MTAHRYDMQLRWTGNLGQGTSGYRAYSRAYELTGEGKPVVVGSSDPAFRGDATRYNPEELLVGALSACHMLWFLHKCADAGIVVEEYEDDAGGTMEEARGGGGRFTEVTLRPRTRFRDEPDAERLRQLHEDSHAACFIAASVNFPVVVEPRPW